MIQAAAWGLATAVAVLVLAWLLSIARRDVGIVDVFWGPATLAMALVYAGALPGGWRGLSVLLLVAVWALRLSWHIARRNQGRPEDRRYRAMRAKRGPSFWWRSLYVVFLPQALIGWVLAWPILGAMSGGGPPGWLDAAGFALWGAGFLVEAVADRQLARFLAQPDRDQAVMDRGLWRYSRHPNYFGECCQWWGIYLLAAAAGHAWTLFAPVLLTVLLLKVSGVSLTERTITERRPAYRDYMRRTSAFLPLPPGTTDRSER